MLVTVVTVVYNAVQEIEATLQSVVSQSYPHVEYLVIDGGSTDGTLEILKKYEGRIHRLISEPDRGIYDAMNKALGLAQGDFLIFINAGDRLVHADTLSQVAAQIKSPDTVYYGDAYYENRERQQVYERGGEFGTLRIAKQNICHQTLFYPRCIYRQYQYDCRYRLFADWHYNLRIYRKYPFQHLPVFIAYYDAGGVSARQRDLLFEKRQKYFIYKYLGAGTFGKLIFRKFLGRAK